MAQRTLTPAAWPKELTPAHLHRLIRKERDPRRALELFDAAVAGSILPDSATLALVSSRLATAGLYQLAVSLLRRSGAAATEMAFVPVLRALGRAHRPEDAVLLFRTIPATIASTRAYTALLSALVANGRFPLARRVFAEMRAAGVPFSTPTYNVLLAAAAGAFGSDTALRLLARVPEPDVCSYNTVIAALCRGSGCVNDARRLFDEMREKGIAPTVVTYTTLIHWLVRSNAVDDAVNLFAEMCGQGIEPNVVTYSSMIDGLCKAGESLNALRLLERMIKARILPNSITYSSLVDGLCKEDRLQEAMEVLDRMRLQGRRPDAGLFGKLIIGLCDSGRPSEAANYLDEMVLGGVTPNAMTRCLHSRIHNAVASALARRAWVSRALVVYQGMRSRGIAVEPSTFEQLAECLCKKGNVDKAADVINDMLSAHTAPDRGLLDAVVGGYCQRKKARQMVEKMLEKLIKI